MNGRENVKGGDEIQLEGFPPPFPMEESYSLLLDICHIVSAKQILNDSTQWQGFGCFF